VTEQKRDGFFRKKRQVHWKPEQIALLVTTHAVYSFPPPMFVDGECFLVLNSYQRVPHQDIEMISLPYEPAVNNAGDEYAKRTDKFALHLRKSEELWWMNDEDSSMWIEVKDGQRSQVVDTMCDAHECLLDYVLELDHPSIVDLQAKIESQSIKRDILHRKFEWWGLRPPVRAGYMFYRVAGVGHDTESGKKRVPGRTRGTPISLQKWSRRWCVVYADNSLVHFASRKEWEAFLYVATSSTQDKFPQDYNVHRIHLPQCVLNKSYDRERAHVIGFNLQQRTSYEDWDRMSVFESVDALAAISSSQSAFSLPSGTGANGPSAHALAGSNGNSHVAPGTSASTTAAAGQRRLLFLRPQQSGTGSLRHARRASAPANMLHIETEEEEAPDLNLDQLSPPKQDRQRHSDAGFIPDSATLPVLATHMFRVTLDSAVSPGSSAASGARSSSPSPPPPPPPPPSGPLSGFTDHRRTSDEWHLLQADSKVGTEVVKAWYKCIAHRITFVERRKAKQFKVFKAAAALKQKSQTPGTLPSRTLKSDKKSSTPSSRSASVAAGSNGTNGTSSVAVGNSSTTSHESSGDDSGSEAPLNVPAATGPESEMEHTSSASSMSITVDAVE
jgi:hypothetical protein